MSENQHTTHITPLWIYFAVGGALLVLTAVTVGVSFIDFTSIFGVSSMNFAVAMIIATIKATLVALFFMHLYSDSKFYSLTLLSGIACLMIFIVITLLDTNFRGKIYEIEGQPIEPAAKIYQSENVSDQ
ncbi:MAG: cytochrome C oxidase subunit IV family protein [Bdellovibrionales bacterium]|nr:cytochrome C oxidase subunit IV family protein [Bdellovibrionales bacterium]